MNLTKSSNPAFKNAFNNIAYTGDLSTVMTLKGTINKTLLSLLLVIVGAMYTWKMALYGGGNASAWMLGGGIGGFIVALITVFKKEWAPYTVPVYSFLEGLLLGGLSATVAASFSTEPGSSVNSQIVVQAVSLTFGVFLAMLMAYRSGIIKATQKFKMGVVAATGGVFLVYMLGFIFSLFGVELGFLYGNSMLAIGINLVVVVIAAFNLILDFDFIEQGVRAKAPKYMEWYGAFGLMVTLIWLYIELLRLLSRLASRN